MGLRPGLSIKETYAWHLIFNYCLQNPINSVISIPRVRKKCGGSWLIRKAWENKPNVIKDAGRGQNGGPVKFNMEPLSIFI